MQSIYCLFGKLCLYKAFPKECFSFTLHFKCLRACIMNIKCRNKCCECSQKSAGQPKKNCYIFSFATSLSACSADKSLLVETARTCTCACMCERRHARVNASMHTHSDTGTHHHTGVYLLYLLGCDIPLAPPNTATIRQHCQSFSI